MLTIADQLYTNLPDGSLRPIRGMKVSADPSQTPLFVKDSTGTFRDVLDPHLETYTDNAGKYSIVLPWPSETVAPSGNAFWTLTLPDGTLWAGTPPEAVVGPLTVKQLKDSYSWAPNYTAPTVPVTPPSIANVHANLQSATLAGGATDNHATVVMVGKGANIPSGQKLFDLVLAGSYANPSTALLNWMQAGPPAAVLYTLPIAGTISVYSPGWTPANGVSYTLAILMGEL